MDVGRVVNEVQQEPPADEAACHGPGGVRPAPNDLPGNPQLDLSLAGGTDLPSVRTFYESVGYGGGLDPADRILVGRRDDAIIAAVRLRREMNTLVLRGMYVAAPLRGQGVGRALLDGVSVEIGGSCCWCLPFSRLENFYARIGFGIPEGGEIPEFLVARKDRYEAAGHDVVIMVRPARTSPQ